MKLGAEPKKVAILLGLLVVAAVVLYTNFSSSDAPPRNPSPRPAPAASPSAPVAVSPLAPLERPAAARAPAASRERAGGEFRPSLKPRRPEDRPDPAAIDPTLRLDLLAKLQNVKLEGGDRSLFEFSQPKPPKVPDVKIQPKSGSKPEEAAKPKTEEAKPAAPSKPPPPPIQLKFYGYISPVQKGVKRAFFLDGEEIIVAAEGELIKRRYKVVRIGLNSVVVEDTEHKHQQTLALEERAG